jgi:hypothetical protein
MLHNRGFLTKQFAIAVLSVSALIGPAMPAFAQNSNLPPQNDPNGRQVDQQSQQVQKPWVGDANYQRELDILKRKADADKALLKARAKERVVASKNSSRGRASLLDLIVSGFGGESAQSRKIQEVQNIQEQKLEAAIMNVDSNYAKGVDRLKDKYENAATKAQKAAADKVEKEAKRSITTEQRTKVKKDAEAGKSLTKLEQMKKDAMKQLYKNHVSESLKEGKEPLDPQDFFKNLADKQQQEAAAKAAAPKAPSGP